MNLDEMTDAQLGAMKERVEKILRSRQRAALLKEECYCDRYTCGRCQALDSLK